MKLPSVLKPSVIALPLRMTGPVTIGPVRSKGFPLPRWPSTPFVPEMSWASANESLASVSKSASLVTTKL